MPKIRIGLTTDFNLVGEQVGIGTTNPSATLEVAGEILTENLSSRGGISTFREYQGFSQAQSTIGNKSCVVEGEGVAFGSLSAEIKIVGETVISSGSTVEVGKTRELTVTDKFSLPLGNTDSRDNSPEAGTTRFNQDLGTLEFFDGLTWKSVNSHSSSNSGRAVYSGGHANPADLQVIDYYNLHTTGNAIYFGDATITESRKAGCASATRGLSGGTDDTSNHDTIDYVTIASGGNAADFADLYNGRGTSASMSSSTRGLWAGGRAPTNQDTIDYVEIASLGGTAEDFGNITTARQWLAGCSNSTRGIIAGGESPSFASPTRTSRIEYITMASKGDALLFGDLTAITGTLGGCSNSTRGFFGGGEPGSPSQTKIDMITIASTGNAIRFGELTSARLGVNGAGSQTRGTFLGGWQNLNTIDYITMSTEGDAIDFGDLTLGRWSGASFSDCHGGLGGF